MREMPAGLAISTAFEGPRGDPIGFYVVGPDDRGRYHVQDDGRTIPWLEASGADLSAASRRRALADLLTQYDARYDENEGELATDPVAAEAVPAVALRFVALMLRVQDLLLLTRDRVANTFRQDVAARLAQALGPSATLAENEPVDPSLAEVTVDLVLRSEGREPVALFLAHTDARLQDAIFLQMAAQYEARVPCRVVAMLETGSAVSQKMRQRADNRLDAVPVFRGDEVAATARVRRLVLGSNAVLH